MDGRMKTSRRRFFGLVAAIPLTAVAAPAIVEMVAADLAPVAVNRASILAPAIIARVGLASLENNTLIARKIMRDFNGAFLAAGDRITIRCPTRSA